MEVTSLKAKLQEYGQDHLLEYWSELSQEAQKELYSDVMSLDLDYVTQSFERCAIQMKNGGDKLDDRMEPLPSSICGSILNLTEEEKYEYEQLAFNEIGAGNMAILLLAGGQGTRLGVSYPKGMYDVGLLSGKSLFQLQAERIGSLERLAEERTGLHGNMVLYIMTSKTTVEPTTNFFEERDYFGLKPENVVVFQQGTMPCFTFDGKIMLNSKSQVARAPDGNGGLYRALKNCGILEDMKKRGIKYIQLYCVDNVLVRVGDPVFTGYCISKEAECGNKVVPKGFPQESVGITCKVDGKYQVVEYSEITSKSAELRNDDGSLTYSAANICNHFFTFNFLSKVVKEKDLVHHVAKKKIPSLENGTLIKPDKPNGIKMEKFVFDVFQFAQKFVVWECIREDEFAPLKNAPGASDFSPIHCRNALYALHQKYITAAGGSIVDDEGKVMKRMISPAVPKEASTSNFDDNNNEFNRKHVVMVEISPLVSYSGEGLEGLVKNKRLQAPLNLLNQESL